MRLRIRGRTKFVILAVLVSMLAPTVERSQAQTTASAGLAVSAVDAWPRSREANGASVVTWAPQIESWDNHAKIVFRAAISVRPAGRTDSVYGVVLVHADTLVDYDRRVVVGNDIQREIRFPNQPPDEAARLAGIVDAVVPTHAMAEVPLDLVLAHVRSTGAEQRAVTVNLDPPRIFFSQTPAILVVFMGVPKLHPVQGGQSMFAVNTNWDVFYDPAGSQYFLLNGESWLTTPDPVRGPWRPAKSLPPSVSLLPADPHWAEVKKHIPGKPAGKAPVVFVSLEPAEMILLDGDPAYSPVPRTKLMYISNTASAVFFHVGESQFYYLVAGRWFRAKKLTGPWSAATTSLPKDFQQIPADHPLAAVRASVPGTEEAKDAILLASVPRTVEIKIGQAPSATLAYEGAPKFEPIGAIGVSYAVNTPYDVFVVEDKYYWAYQAVWYCGAAPQGLWSACTSVPAQIYQIPPTSPKHNVTYVYVYSTQPATQTIVVGYTAGYQGEYVAAAGVLMFGAGMAVGAALSDHGYYHYGWPPPPGFYSYGSGSYYHYGYGGYYSTAHAYGPYGSAGAWAGYNPATGTYSRGGYASGPYGSGSWGSAYNPSTGARAVGGQVSTAYGSRGGYAAYNPYTGAASRGGYASGKNGSVYAQSAYNPSTGASGARAGYSTAQGSGGRGYVQTADGEAARGGYRSTSQGTVAGVQTSQGGGAAGVQTARGTSAAGKTASGDVYASHDGNVYRKTSGGSWEQNTGSGWSSAQPPTAQPRSAASQSGSAAQRPPGPEPSTSSASRPSGSQFERPTGGASGGGQTERSGGFGGGQGERAGGGGFWGERGGGGGGFGQLNHDSWARGRSEGMGGSFASRFGGGGGWGGGGRFGGGGRR